MKRITINYSILVFLLLSSCASIPASTTTLTQEILKQAAEMNTLNISLINQLYATRKDQVNSFITNEYTPALLDNFAKKLPDSLDYKKELPNILTSIVPIINRKKDSIQTILDTEQGQLISQINTNYTAFNTAGASLQNLIDSAVKLKTEEKSVMTAVQNLTNGKVNISEAETKLDSLLTQSGSAFSKLLEISSALNTN